MSEEKRKILEMLSQGKITTEEAENLLNTVQEDLEVFEDKPKRAPKYLRIQVQSNKPEKGEENVNIRIPFFLLKSGMKIASMMPKGLQAKVTDALDERGFSFDLSKAKGEDLNQLIEALSEMSIDVDSKGDNSKVRIFCE